MPQIFLDTLLLSKVIFILWKCAEFHLTFLFEASQKISSVSMHFIHNTYAREVCHPGSFRISSNHKGEDMTLKKVLTKPDGLLYKTGDRRKIHK